MIEWRLYYEDKTFDSAQGAPHESPPWGVILVVQPHIESEKIITGAEYLLWRTDLGRWCRCGESGLVDHLAHFAHLIGAVRPGRYIPTVDYKAIAAQAKKDWGLP